MPDRRQKAAYNLSRLLSVTHRLDYRMGPSSTGHCCYQRSHVCNRIGAIAGTWSAATVTTATVLPLSVINSTLCPLPS